MVARLATRARTAYYKARYRSVQFGPGVRAAGKLKITGGGRVILGSGVFFDRPIRPTVIHVAEGATVRIGDSCYVNGLEVMATRDVTIGRRCILADAFITTTNYHSTRVDRHDPATPVKQLPVSIGDNVWLATRCVILPGVEVGADSVVSLGAVVYANVAAGVVVSSHEQRVVKRL